MATKSYPKVELTEKEPTQLQKNFIRYIKAETGYDVDVTTVVLFQALRTPFQKSDVNRADLVKRQEVAEERKNAPKPEKKASSKKAPAKGAAAPAKRPAKKLPAKKALARPLRSVPEDAESPFADEA